MTLRRSRWVRTTLHRTPARSDGEKRTAESCTLHLGSAVARTFVNLTLGPRLSDVWPRYNNSAAYARFSFFSFFLPRDSAAINPTLSRLNPFFRKSGRAYLGSRSPLYKSFANTACGRSCFSSGWLAWKWRPLSHCPLSR